jgi:glutamyl-tRNA reductase
MVLGEAEILHQVKRAYETARDHGATGKLFHALFQRALNTAKTVRSHTDIGRGCTSIGTVSVELAGKIFGRLSSAVVVLLGAGKIGELTVKRLADRGVKELRILNRSPERAAELAAAYGASALPIERLAEQLADADIVITSTSAPSPLLHQGQVADAMRARRQRPLCFVDLGVPRNLDPAIGSLENVYLFNIDDLQGLVQHVHLERLHAVGASQAIVDRKVERFLAWRREESERLLSVNSAHG